LFAISYFIIIFIGLFIATVIDVKTRRIPNWLTVSLTLIGLGNSFIAEGLIGLGGHTIAMLIGLITFFLFYLLKVFGAGDAKMMASLGAIMGFPFIIYASVMVIIVGGIISFFLLVKKNGLREIWFVLTSFIKALFSGNLKDFHGWINDTSENTFPFSIAITIGSVITLWYLYPSI